MNATRRSAYRPYGPRRTVTASRYPNAANRRYFWDRLADSALCVASGVGIVTVLFFLLTMI